MDELKKNVKLFACAMGVRKVFLGIEFFPNIYLFAGFGEYYTDEFQLQIVNQR